MKPLRILGVFTVVYFASTGFAQVHPEIFSVSDKIVIGAQRLHTRYLYAVGAWSDAGDMENYHSVQIECYKRIGFCNVARALVDWPVPGVGVMLDGFDILRWDEGEMIAVDNSPTCVVNTIRADFIAKTITISKAAKSTDKLLCEGIDLSPAFLVNSDEINKRILQKAKQKKP
jgi:hypothetical protein